MGEGREGRADGEGVRLTPFCIQLHGVISQFCIKEGTLMIFRIRLCTCAVKLIQQVALPLCWLALVAIASPATAQKSPEKIRLTPASDQGAVLIRIDRIPAKFQLWFQKSGKSGFGSRVYMIPVAAGERGELYIARTLTPGRYRLDSIWQQLRWGLLLSGDTVEFDIKPGSVTYLGKLDTWSLLTTLQDMAVAAGVTVSHGTSGYSTAKHGLRPSFSGRDDNGLADAKSYAATTMGVQNNMVELGEIRTMKIDAAAPDDD